MLRALVYQPDSYKIDEKLPLGTFLDILIASEQGHHGRVTLPLFLHGMQLRSRTKRFRRLDVDSVDGLGTPEDTIPTLV